MRYDLLFRTAVAVTLAPLVTVIILEILCTVEKTNAGERVVSDIGPEALTRKRNEVQSSLWDCCYCNTSTFSYSNHLRNTVHCRENQCWRESGVGHRTRSSNEKTK